MPTLLVKNAEVLVTMDGQRRELKGAGLYAENGFGILFCAPQTAKYTVINGKVIVRDGEIITMDMKPVIETQNRCAAQMVNA